VSAEAQAGISAREATLQLHQSPIRALGADVLEELLRAIRTTVAQTVRREGMTTEEKRAIVHARSTSCGALDRIPLCREGGVMW
jgi:hypothetical protein